MCVKACLTRESDVGLGDTLAHGQRELQTRAQRLPLTTALLTSGFGVTVLMGRVGFGSDLGPIFLPPA